jgi:hypothetical protein
MNLRFVGTCLVITLTATLGAASLARAGGAWRAKHQCVEDCGDECGDCVKCRRCGIKHGTGQCGDGCGNRRAAKHSCEEWACGYYHTMWGQPVALIVPPTAELQTHWNWGVAQTAVTPIWPQFSREYPGPYYGGRGFLPTPRWPSSTDQFGVYYVRGPW